MPSTAIVKLKRGYASEGLKARSTSSRPLSRSFSAEANDMRAACSIHAVQVFVHQVREVLGGRHRTFTREPMYRFTA
jgi:hypothetical protein